ncbi:hypothetical protein KUTeg_018944 [Tegillarca granosa]|uniref:Chromo domain-containing protein n=1 Tax=Tegillarca granosa TaxID=220873 RepID=A0ABQ9EH20_TEGGR|nr:hypothetical protein KUTeg_018944 [Tegillarca granosa]
MASSDESGSEFEVSKILKQRKRKGLIEYLVQWKGFDQDDSWEPSKNLKYCQKAIDDFNNETSARKSRSRSASRSRSRSRGRSSSRGRKSPARRKSSPKKESKSETTMTVRSRRSVAGGTVEKTEVVTKSVEEIKPKADERTQRSIIREKVETVKVTRTNSTPSEKKRWKVPEYLRFTSSDYPVMIIFVCISVIMLTFVLEKHVK